jgi:hypothetical protein
LSSFHRKPMRYRHTKISQEMMMNSSTNAMMKPVRLTCSFGNILSLHMRIDSLAGTLISQMRWCIFASARSKAHMFIASCVCPCLLTLHLQQQHGATAIQLQPTHGVGGNRYRINTAPCKATRDLTRRLPSSTSWHQPTCEEFTPKTLMRE